uniref:Uncharacterized protein n=1 Tax=Xenopus tropicalis TaxID=8364 RepID=A0A1B8XY67_XENTR
MARRILSKVFCCLPLFRKKRIVIKDKEVVILVQPEEQQNQPTETICEQPVPPTGNVVSQDNPEQIVGLGDNTFQEQTEDETGVDIHQEPVHPTSNVVAQEPPEQNRQQTYIFDEEPEEFHGSNESEEEEDYNEEPDEEPKEFHGSNESEEEEDYNEEPDEEPEEFHGSNESEEEEDYDEEPDEEPEEFHGSNESEEEEDYDEEPDEELKKFFGSNESEEEEDYDEESDEEELLYEEIYEEVYEELYEEVYGSYELEEEEDCDEEPEEVELYEEFYGSYELEEEVDYDEESDEELVYEEIYEEVYEEVYEEEVYGSDESEEDYGVQNNCIRRNINRSNEERISAKKESTPGRICYQPETWLLRYVPKRKGKGWKGLGTSGAKMHLLNAMNQLCSERSSSDNSQTLICLIFLDVYVLYMYIIFCLRKCIFYNKSFIKKRNKLQK